MAEPSDALKSRIGRFLMVNFLAATSVIAGVIWQMQQPT
jgi:hypothetical protein